jgi:hypothetical protein
MTTDPAWGTPPTGLSGRPVSEPEFGAGGFFLVIEQLTGSGSNRVWRVEPVPVRAGTTRERARVVAGQLAQKFRPNHPMSEQSRAVYRVDEDTLIVIVDGATTSFHFRVSVVEKLA